MYPPSTAFNKADVPSYCIIEVMIVVDDDDDDDDDEGIT
jgi:hypothetical protein